MELPRQQIYHRMVKVNPNDYTALKVGLVMWIVSAYWFKKQRFAVDKNMFNWALFSFGSLFSSVAYAKFFFESPLAAAAKINNSNEIAHQKNLGNL